MYLFIDDYKPFEAKRKMFFLLRGLFSVSGSERNSSSFLYEPISTRSG